MNPFNDEWTKWGCQKWIINRRDTFRATTWKKNSSTYLLFWCPWMTQTSSCDSEMSNVWNQLIDFRHTIWPDRELNSRYTWLVRITFEAPFYATHTISDELITFGTILFVILLSGSLRFTTHRTFVDGRIQPHSDMKSHTPSAFWRSWKQNKWYFCNECTSLNFDHVPLMVRNFWPRY